ncbi:MAG: hypothetical protein V6Z89_21440 [Desulfobacter sp.]
MRFLLSLCIWIVFVGGLWLYTWQRDAGFPEGPSQAQAVEQIKGEFLLEITPTFSVEKDPFALQAGTGDSAPFALYLNGKAIAVPAGDIRRGQVVRISDLPDMQQGTNEFYINASPPLAENTMDNGVRLRLTDRGAAIVDHTIWGNRGAVVSGTVSFTLAHSGDDDHAH